MRKRRRERLLVDTARLGRAFLQARDNLGQKNNKSWALQWAKQHFPDQAGDEKAIQSLLRLCRRAAAKVDLAPGENKVSPVMRGAGTSGVCTTSVRPSHRKRGFGAGRPRLQPEVGEELFTWFVDTIENIHGRIPAFLALHQAQLIVQNLRQYHQIQIENGHLDPNEELKVPNLDSGWLRSWRRFYGISYRIVNLRFKCPRSLLLKRLAVFWENCLRVRALHALLEPEGRLVVEGFDQKPLWFTAASEEKTLHFRGKKKVNVKENMPMTRARFSAMTRCRWPTPPEDGKELGILFKAGGKGEKCGVKIRPGLKVPHGVLLQFQQKGSYRLEDVHEYLKWIMDRSRVPVDPGQQASSQGPPLAPGTRVIYLLDWFKPHLDESLDNLVHDYGHAILRIGGHLTGLVQVEDTHAHGPYTAAYKKAETKEALWQLEVNPGRLPSTSHQTVMDRALESWHTVNHESCTKGFVANGICGALDGSEDHLLTEEVRPFWTQLDMPARREKVLQEVRDKVREGELTRFEDYGKLLHSYDEHDGLPEGGEAAAGPPEDYDEDARTEDEDDDEDKGAGDDWGGDEGGAAGSPPMPGNPDGGSDGDDDDDRLWMSGSEGGHDMVPHDPLRPPTTPFGSDDEDVAQDAADQSPCALALPAAKLAHDQASSQAVTVPPPSDPFIPIAEVRLTESHERSVMAINMALAALRKFGGDPRSEEALRSRLLHYRRQQKVDSTEVRKFLCARGIERDEEKKAKRQKTADDASEARRLQLLERLTAAQADKEKACVSRLKLAAKELDIQRDITAKEEKRLQKERDAAQAAENERVRLHFAAYLARRVLKYMRHENPLYRDQRFQRMAKSAVACGKKWRGKQALEVPFLWLPVTKGLLRVSGQRRAVGKQECLWASPDFNFVLRNVKDKNSMQEPRFLFDQLAQCAMPAYHSLMGGRYSLDSLFAECEGVLDLAFVKAVYRYTLAIGKETYSKGLNSWPMLGWGDEETPKIDSFLPCKPASCSAPSASTDPKANDAQLSTSCSASSSAAGSGPSASAT